MGQWFVETDVRQAGRRLFWRSTKVAPHWDKLMLRAHVSENGERKVVSGKDRVTAIAGARSI